MMKVTAAFGSPRKGNSAFLAESLLQSLEKRGATATRWHLHKMNYNGCVVCNACKNGSEDCILQDDLTPFLESMKETDVFILATPIYFFEASSRVRAMLERWYSFLLPMYYTGESRETRLPEGKQAVLIVSQGAPEEQYRDFAQRMESSLQAFNFKPAHSLRCGLGNDPQAAANNRALIAEVERTAELILEGKEPLTRIAPYWTGF